MKEALEIIAILIIVYLMIGILFGIYFVISGAKKMDPLIVESKFKVRLILLPGAIGLWPIILKKLFKK